MRCAAPCRTIERHISTAGARCALLANVKADMTDQASAPTPREDAGTASAEDGLVILDGPDGVAVTMTPRPTSANEQDELGA